MRNQNNTIDLRRLFRVLNYYKTYIIVIAIIISGIYSVCACIMQNQEENYRATSQIYISERAVADNVVGGTSEHVVNDYSTLIQSDFVLKDVQNKLDGKYSENNLRKKISTTLKDNSNVISIEVIDSNPQVAKVIADQVADSAVAQISAISDYYNIYVADYAMNSVGPINENKWVKLIEIFFVMLILVSGLLICMYIIKDNIKDEEFLVQKLETRLLYSIPKKKDIRGYLLQNEVFKKIYICLEYTGTTLMVISPSAGDGKSLFCRGLAEEFVKANKKILLLTLDGMDDKSEIENSENGLDRLRFNRKNAFIGNTFCQCMDKLKKEYDLILIEGGTIDSVESYILMKCCESAIVVLNPENVGVKKLITMKDRLDQFSCKLVGIVLNKVKF